MPDRRPDDSSEPVLGRNLVETALLNSREYRAGRRAAGSVGRPAPPPDRRGRLKGWLWLAAVVGAVGLVALALELAGA